MNLSETARLLAMISSFNNRTIGEGDVVAWHSILFDAALPDTEEAVRRHFAESTEWLMPAHVRRGVRDIERERAKAARQWAPGQHGVPKEQAAPELPRGERLTAADISPEVVALLSQLRAELPDVPREKLFPREADWRRQQRAYRANERSEPNPHYRPGGPVDPDPEEVKLAARRADCRTAGPHDSGVHIKTCPDLVCASPWHQLFWEERNNDEGCETCGAKS